MITQIISRFSAAPAGSGSCSNNAGFFGLPHWYQYLPLKQDSTGNCIPNIRALSDVWLIVAALIDILLRVAVLAAIGFIIWGGIKYITSQGEPERTKQARETIFDAIIAVTFVAGKFN
jgi:hypothetical protein